MCLISVMFGWCECGLFDSVCCLLACLLCLLRMDCDFCGFLWVVMFGADVGLLCGGLRFVYGVGLTFSGLVLWWLVFLPVCWFVIVVMALFDSRCAGCACAL